jgi:small subunit ribosomal protein S17
MAKILTGVVVSGNMKNAVVVEVTRRVPHPKYRKLLKRSKKFKAELNGNTVAVGDIVAISETRPLTKDIHFVISSVVTEKKKEKK